MVAVAALVFALWPAVADAPWELKRTAEGRQFQEDCDRAKARIPAMDKNHPMWDDRGVAAYRVVLSLHCKMPTPLDWGVP